MLLNETFKLAQLPGKYLLSFIFIQKYILYEFVVRSKVVLVIKSYLYIHIFFYTICRGIITDLMGRNMGALSVYLMQYYHF